LTSLSQDTVPISDVSYWESDRLDVDELEWLGVRQMVGAAMAWLATSFPTCAFNDDLEKIIASTASLARER
jgi:N-acyl-L-homoserine lactone synthetase